jgi:hypothetical protein
MARRDVTIRGVCSARRARFGAAECRDDFARSGLAEDAPVVAARTWLLGWAIGARAALTWMMRRGEPVSWGDCSRAPGDAPLARPHEGLGCRQRRAGWARRAWLEVTSYRRAQAISSSARSGVSWPHGTRRSGDHEDQAERSALGGHLGVEAFDSVEPARQVCRRCGAEERNPFEQGGQTGAQLRRFGDFGRPTSGRHSICIARQAPWARASQSNFSRACGSCMRRTSVKHASRPLAEGDAIEPMSLLASEG